VPLDKIHKVSKTVKLSEQFATDNFIVLYIIICCFSVGRRRPDLASRSEVLQDWFKTSFYKFTPL